MKDGMFMEREVANLRLTMRNLITITQKPNIDPGFTFLAQINYLNYFYGKLTGYFYDLVDDTARVQVNPTLTKLYREQLLVVQQM